MRTYYGITIEPAGCNSSGIRWTALTEHGYLRADTLNGIKELIRREVKGARK